MKWYRQILKGIIGVVIIFGFFMFLIEFRDLIIVPKETWQWARWHPWIIIVWFGWIYLAIGIELGIAWQRRYLERLGYLVKYRNKKRKSSLMWTYFQILLAAVSWPLLAVYRLVFEDS